MSQPLWQWSAVAAAEAVRRGEHRCIDLVSAAVQRMRETNPDVNAVTVDLGEQALVKAQAADARLQAGHPARPLEGVPITIKENVDMSGQATTNGVAAFNETLAPEDSPVVRNLELAGAVIVGRTNTPEFSLRYFTDNTLRGLTRNPWDSTITCGGSSGGAAVASVLGMAAINHGNDLIGSLRYPSSCCGVVTIRPSIGRVPAYNPSQPAERPPLTQLMSVQGPIARSVADVRLGLAAMAQRDSRDPWWVPALLEGPPAVQPMQVALSFGPPGARIDPDVKAAVVQAGRILSRHGYEVTEHDPPSLADSALFDLLWTESDTLLWDTISTVGSPAMQRLFQSYLSASKRLDLPAFLKALAARTTFCRDWFQFLEQFTLVLAPASLRLPFGVREDVEGPSSINEVLDAQIMLATVNFLGLPAACVPTGVNAAGVPLGVQIIGSRYREDLCLDAAQVIENDVGVLADRLWQRQKNPAPMRVNR